MAKWAGSRARLLAAGAMLASASLAPSFGVRAASDDVAPSSAPAGDSNSGLPPAALLPSGKSEPIPVQAFTDRQGRSCRVYARTVIIDGVSETALATVCREPNGRWVISR